MTPKTQKNLEYTLATLEIEGCRPSDYAVSLCKRMTEGEITADESVDAILEDYGISSQSIHTRTLH